MAERPVNPREQLELYLDGMLEGEQREAFEAELARSPELREQVELQRRIDESIRRVYPACEVPLPPVVASPTGAHRWVRPALIAAAVLLAAGIGAYFMLFSTQRAPFDQPGEVYSEIVASGFVPREVCTTEAEFIAWTARKFDEPFVVPADAPGIELVGWDYKRILTPRTGVLLARVDGEEVLVLVERRDEALRLGDQPEEGLKVFRKGLGGVVLYEVTPLDEARILPLARSP